MLLAPRDGVREYYTTSHGAGVEHVRQALHGRYVMNFRVYTELAQIMGGYPEAEQIPAGKEKTAAAGWSLGCQGTGHMALPGVEKEDVTFYCTAVEHLCRQNRGVGGRVEFGNIVDRIQVIAGPCGMKGAAVPDIGGQAGIGYLPGAVPGLEYEDAVAGRVLFREDGMSGSLNRGGGQVTQGRDNDNRGGSAGGYVFRAASKKVLQDGSSGLCRQVGDEKIVLTGAFLGKKQAGENGTGGNAVFFEVTGCTCQGKGVTVLKMDLQ